MSQSTIIQSCPDGATTSWVYTSTLGSYYKCLAQGHNLMTQAGVQPRTSGF